MSRFTLAWRKMMPSGTIFKKELFNPLFFFVLHSRARKWIRKEKEKRNFLFKSFTGEWIEVICLVKLRVRKPKQLRKHKQKKKRVKKSKLESSFLSNYVCAGLRVGWNVISRSKKRPRSLPNALLCASPVVYFWKRIFKFEPKMLFWPSLSLSLEILNWFWNTAGVTGFGVGIVCLCVYVCVCGMGRDLYTPGSLYFFLAVSYLSHTFATNNNNRII